jgi:hypothetical protein
MRRPKLHVVLAIAVPLAILGTIFGAAGWHMYARERAVLNGPGVNATVTGYGSCRETRAYDCNRVGGRYGPAEIGVTVAFLGGDGRLTRSVVSYPPGRAPEVGSRIEIRYNPSDPSDAIAIGQHQRNRRAFRRIMVGIAVSLALIFLAAYLRDRRRSRVWPISSPGSPPSA